MLDSIFIKSIQCANFHEINLGKVVNRTEKGRPMIALKDIVLA